MSTLSEKAMKAIEAGERTMAIARRLGCSPSLVSHLRRHGSIEARNRDTLEQRRKRHPPRPRPQNPLRNSIIADVDAGLTYTQVARKYGLASKNVVAGILHRRPEASA